MNQEDRKIFAQLNAAWLAGKKLDDLKYLHNSIAEATLPDGTTKIGYIVAATVKGTEPIYTVEAQDGSGDIQCPESSLRIVESQGNNPQ